jgi:hypothetical protein
MKGKLPENRLSMRLSGHGVGVVNAQRARMEKVSGAAVSRSQAVESLIAAGAQAWETVQRIGSWNVAKLVEAGVQDLTETTTNKETHE